jgi:hypothetical protein
MQSWLASRAEVATTAAAVAELFAGQSPEKVLATSRKSFLFVAANRLRKEDWCNSNGLEPNPALAASVEQGCLGDVDAFISHSWHDDPTLKWAKLQEWRAAFRQVHGREPKLWIDKYCIDQTKIDDSLACLPVYLAGCKTLVIFCGETYLKRLWCLVEIFVFLEMGGHMDNLEVHLLQDEADPLPLKHQLANFNPAESRCSTEDDTERLQAVIRATGHECIKKLVSDAFVKTSRSNVHDPCLCGRSCVAI